MPPKRPAKSSGPSTPTKKSKRSSSSSQASLTSFFGSPKKVRSEEGTPATSTRAEKGKESIHAEYGSSAGQEGDDARFAAWLAAEDAKMDVEKTDRHFESDEEMARRLQEEWTKADVEHAASSIASSSKHRIGENAQKTERMDIEAQDLMAADSVSMAVKQEPSTSTQNVFRRQTKTPGAASNGKRSPSESASVTMPNLKSQGAASTSNTDSHTPFDVHALDRSIEAIPLGDDIFTFDPSSVDTSTWPRVVGGPNEVAKPTVPYALLTRAFVLITATRSRLAITTLLTNLLRVVRAHDPESLLPAVYLVSNHIAPAYDGVELGLGGALVSKAVKEVTGRSARIMKALWEKTGDPGDVAYEAKKDVSPLVRPAPITVQKLFSTLHTISRLSGQGSSAQKLGHATRLLVASRGEETRFLVRTFHSHLRINAVRTTIATALARTFALVEPVLNAAAPANVKLENATDSRMLVSPAERHGLLANPAKAKERAGPRRVALMEKLNRAEKLVREVRARHPNFGNIVPALLEVGLEGLSARVPLSVGTPLSPMLGSITRSLPAMHTKLGPRAFVSEFKYDGQRVQIHASHVPRQAGAEARGALSSSGKGKWVGRDGDVYVRLFSRHLEDMTDKYPDINDLVPILMGVDPEDEISTSGKGFDEATHDDATASDVADQPIGASSDAENASVDRAIRSFVMDAEVVAIGPDGGLLPFQTLANRSRKDVSIHEVKVKVGVFAFDLMLLDGQSLLKSSFRKRRHLLHTRFTPLAPRDPLIARFAHVRSCESNDPDEVAAFFEAARAHKCEGIMVKSLDHHWETRASSPTLDVDGSHRDGDADVKLEKLGDEVEEGLDVEDDDAADAEGAAAERDNLDQSKALVGKGVNGRGKALLSTYEPDKRCESWLKVKKDYIDGIGDSLDLVPIGAWHGMGRKATWWSPILLALYDPDTGGYQAVCKCISGFTDAFYKDLNVRFTEGTETCYSARNGPPRDYYETGNLIPDVWFTPCEVWEVRGADITLSPAYTAAIGLVSAERGLSMRFPRFIERREDKSPENASTPQMLADLYLQQQAAGPKPEPEPDRADAQLSEAPTNGRAEEHGATEAMTGL